MKILVADDDLITRKLLNKALESMGYEVILVEDGKKAWEVFQDQEIRFVICDWEMPEMDGITLCNRIRNYSAGWYCYVILITIKSESSHLKRVFEAGADDYIVKPFNVDELGMRVKTGERIIDLENGHNKLTNCLIESRNKLKVIFDSLTAEFVVLDKRFIVESANKPFAINHGLGFKEIIGASVFELDANLFNDESRMAIEAVFTSGKSKFFLLRIKGPEGEILVKDIHCLPIGDESENVSKVAFSARDVTEERKKTDAIKTLNEDLTFAMAQIQSKNNLLEDALHQIRGSQAQILQSEKMASIGQLAAGVAHEINNPTGFVSSNLRTLNDYMGNLLRLIGQYRQFSRHFLKDGMTNPLEDGRVASQLSDISNTEKEIDIDYLTEDIPALIEESRDGMDRIQKIVRNLKDFAHPEDEQKLATINDCIESTLNIIWNEIKYKAKLEKHYGDIPPLLCYPRQLNQVFLNLLVNAAQAIESNGTIGIETKRVNDNARVLITDTGQGIPPENISKIFEPFFTTKPVGKGTGLGLHLVYNIVKKHGGTVRVESEIGKGTTFTVDIPLNEKTDASVGAEDD
jgi:two-component system, NtrC family, sensor kinase